LSVNGIATSVKSGEKIAVTAEKVTKQVTQAVTNNTHFFVLGDLIQTITESVGFINTPSLNVADTARIIYGNYPDITIEATSHSQGGSVTKGGLALLNDNIKSKISSQTFGAQVAITDSGLKNTYNERGIKDPIPFIDPRNWLNNLNGNITTYSDGKDGHNFEKHYGEDAIERSEQAEIKK